MPPLPQTTTGTLHRPDGARIVYEVTGAGPALVFAHGLGGNHLSWWQQVPAFSGTHRVVTFSHRGFSPSSVPGGVPDPHDYAGDLVALLDHLGIAQAVIIGQSMGGWTCVETALAAPERVKALVLACTTGSFDFDRFGDAQVAAWRKTAPSAIAALSERNIHRAAGARMADESPVLFGLYQAIDRLNAGLDKDEVGRRIRAMRTRGAEDAARITMPVLCITGEEDLLISARGVGLVAGTLPDAEVSVIPASGHSVYFERATLFNAITRRFLDAIGWG